MARQFAKLQTSTWSDAEFCALSIDAKLALLFLESQPDLSLAGVLVARTSGWAKRGGSGDREAFEAALEELETAGRIVWDREDDEVWIESFIRDNVNGSPKTTIGASKAWAAVRSADIRGRILASVPAEIVGPFVSQFDGMKFAAVRALVNPDAAPDGSSDGVSDGSSPTENGDLRSETGEEGDADPDPEPDAVDLAERLIVIHDKVQPGEVRNKLQPWLASQAGTAQLRGELRGLLATTPPHSLWPGELVKKLNAAPTLRRGDRPSCPNPRCRNGNLEDEHGNHDGRCTCVGGPAPRLAATA